VKIIRVSIPRRSRPITRDSLKKKKLNHLKNKQNNQNFKINIEEVE